MKTEIHPKYTTVAFKCACGSTYTAGSTLSVKEFHTEVCSNCHPFYTGKQKLMDSSGRVDKFMAKRKKAQENAAKNVKLVEDDDDDTTVETPTEEVIETAPEEATEEPTEEVVETAPEEATEEPTEEVVETAPEEPTEEKEA